MVQCQEILQNRSILCPPGSVLQNNEMLKRFEVHDRESPPTVMLLN